MISLELSKSHYKEIRSVLAKNGRDDLLMILRKCRDDNYTPPSPTAWGSDSDSDSEGEEEELHVVVDREGFCSLRD